jgi:amidase
LGGKKSETAFQSATELTKAIRDRRIGSTELLELYIKRYERLNPKINAIVATDLKVLVNADKLSFHPRSS